MHVLYNKKLLKNIRKAYILIHIHWKLGLCVVNLVWEHKKSGMVYYYPKAIYNIPPLSKIGGDYKITYVTVIISQH